MATTISIPAADVKHYAESMIKRIVETQRKRKAERIFKYQKARETFRELPVVRWFKRWLPPLTDAQAEAAFTMIDDLYVNAHWLQKANCEEILAAACLAIDKNSMNAHVALDTDGLTSLGLKGYRNA